jgi:hypothetical protein
VKLKDLRDAAAGREIEVPRAELVARVKSAL